MQSESGDLSRKGGGGRVASVFASLPLRSSPFKPAMQATGLPMRCSTKAGGSV